MLQSVVCIGNFDGVHRAHTALVRAARRAADAAPGGPLRVVVVTFDPHPAAVLAGKADPAHGPFTALTSLERRTELLLAAGADQVDVLDPECDEARWLSRSPDQFIEAVCQAHRPAVILEGDDFRFGRGRAGGLEHLAELGVRFGFEVRVLPPVHVGLRDQTLVRVSSTWVRRMLRAGRVRDAALLLGRPHELEGVVVRGDRRGRQLGFPTANVRTMLLAPGEGVYAAVATLPDGSRHAAAVNVGAPPTFGAVDRRIEAHVLCADGLAAGGASGAWAPLPGLDEYGWSIRLSFVGWVRDQVRFSGPAAVAGQLGRDCERVRTIAGDWLDRDAAEAGPLGAEAAAAHYRPA